MVYIAIEIIENEIDKESYQIFDSKEDAEKWIEECIEVSIGLDCEHVSTPLRNRNGEPMLYYPTEGENVEKIKFESNYMVDSRENRKYYIINGDITNFERRNELERKYYDKVVEELKDYSDLE